MLCLKGLVGSRYRTVARNVRPASMLIVQTSGIYRTPILIRYAAMNRKLDAICSAPHRFKGAAGIDEVMRWARSDRGQYQPACSGCDSGMCGD